MVHAVVLDVPAPVDMYDAIHAQLLQHDVTSLDGQIPYLGRSTAAGFQVIDVWESAEQYDRYNREVLRPIMARLAQGRTVLPPESTVIDVHGLVIPYAPVAL